MWSTAGLIGGPLLAIGDLLHPQESMVPTEQVAIILELAGRWYTSHLLLFIGMMLFIPGLLALGALAEAQARRRVCSILRDATHAAAIPRG